ncbi:MAG: LutC/YkgG family protein [Corynebacterium sp.]|uniref:LutC/YkgG family protein n=1 Tax=Corynebacterium sp. TaxID=1720 RepID=UPI003F992B62
MTDARTEILNRVRSSLGRTSEAAPTQEHIEIPREYRTSGDKDGQELLDLLIDRLEDYDAAVTRTGGSTGEIAEAVATLLGDAGEDSSGSSIVVPATLDHGWLADLQATVRDDSTEAPVDLDTLNSVDAVVTGSAVSVADTGTIMLVGPESGRRATTLVPDHHIVVVKVEDVVEIVPEAISRLTRDGLSELPITMVSGPSATVDIELIRVHGVHGPRTLDVIIAG